MSNRKPLTKKQRFEIFKRDGFTCQYCGRRPPDVVLEVDHIIPVKNDGDNDPQNLITSCYDCNHGKGYSMPTDKTPVPDASVEALALQQEIAELALYLRLKKERDETQNRVIQALSDQWASCFNSKYVPQERQFITWLSLSSPEDIERAIIIASNKPDMRGQVFYRDPDKVIRYVSGVLHNITRREK